MKYLKLGMLNKNIFATGTLQERESNRFLIHLSTFYHQPMKVLLKSLQ
jgi:hypothetical protein